MKRFLAVSPSQAKENENGTAKRSASPEIRRLPAPSSAELAQKTIDYAEAKTAYFKALRAEVPEMMKIAMGVEERPPELDTFAAAFAVAGEDQEKAADEETAVLLKRFSRYPEVQKAREEFDRAQKVEEKFHKDFDGQDFTKR